MHLILDCCPGEEEAHRGAQSRGAGSGCDSAEHRAEGGRAGGQEGGRLRGVRGCAARQTAQRGLRHTVIRKRVDIYELPFFVVFFSKINFSHIHFSE